MKKILAIAIASAFAAPAFAATSNVDIGGYMNFSVDYLDSDNATNGGNVGISSNASNIFFKGAEDLGGGLKAIWQVQTYFDAGGTGNDDSSGSSGTGNNSDLGSNVGQGNTYVGLAGGFGTVLVGKNESPFKLLSRKVDLFGNQIGDNRNLTAVGGFDLRPNNQIAYTTPNMGGFSGALSYSSNLDAGAAVDNSVDVWAATGTYANGPLMLGLGYQKSNNTNGTAAEDAAAWRANVGFNIASFKVVAFYQDASDIGGVSGADRDTWGLGTAYKMGNVNLKAQYYTTDDLGSAANTGADMWAVGADYSLSKRTTLQFAYAETDNDSAANFSAFGGGHGDQPAVSAGGNPSGFSVGMVHKF